MEDGHVVNSVVQGQTSLHQPFGGVVPEIAARAHVERMIPALDEAGWIAGTVASAAAEGVEIVVVDGGSRDATAELAASAGAARPPGANV